MILFNLYIFFSMKHEYGHEHWTRHGHIDIVNNFKKTYNSVKLYVSVPCLVVSTSRHV